MAIKWDTEEETTPTTGIQWEGSKGLNKSQTALAQSQRLNDMLRQSEEANKQAKEASSIGGLAKETGKQTVNTLFGGVVKAARSGVEAVGEMFGAKPNYQQTYTDFAGTPQKSLQGEVYAGEKTPLQGAGEFALESAATLPLAKGAQIVSKPIVKAGEQAGKLLEPVAKKTAGVVGRYLAERAEKKATDTAVKALTPKLTSTEMIGATTKEGKGVFSNFGGSKIDMTKDKRFMEQVSATKGLVKGKSAVQDVNSLREAIGKEADSLKTQIKEVDHPYTFTELSAKLSNAKEPISLRGTPFEKQIKPIKEAAIEIAKKKGGNISGLLDARKEFDDLVERTYPNLWESENAPMRNAITAIRNEMNDFISNNLPEGVGFKESLKKQRLFYDALDNVGTKIPDEIKKGGLLKRTLKNPIVQTVGAGTVGAGVVSGGSKLLGD